jgi:hypothetical protein
MIALFTLRIGAVFLLPYVLASPTAIAAAVLL